MNVDLDALRLIIAKEHSFSPRQRYLEPSHEAMVPLLIAFTDYFKYIDSTLSLAEKRELRLKAMGIICQKDVSSFYDLTSWEVSSIANFLKGLNDEEENKASRFIDFVLSQGA